ncbi:MAG: AMP-binding protein [Elusimicrobiota bacterium]|nr:AMP-binding protein [Elusimicrobiota bacterium]
MDNLAQFFLNRSRRYSQRTAYEEFTGGSYLSFSYRQIRKDVLSFAGYLKSKGFTRDSKLGILAKNSVYWSIAYFAGQVLGIPVIPLDPLLSPRDNIHYLRHSGADILFIDPDIFEQMDLDTARGLNLKEVVLSDGKTYASKEVSSIENILKENSVPSPAAVTREVEIDKDDPAIIIYTSGTTGSPKGVLLTHGNIIHQIKAISKAIKFEKDDVFIGLLPLFHTFPSTTCMLTPFNEGCKVVFLNSLKAASIVRVLKEKKVSIMIGVPALFESLKRAMERKIGSASIFKRAFVGTAREISAAAGAINIKALSFLFKGLKKKAGMNYLRLMASGGAPLMPKTGRFFQMMGIEFIQGYGLTETSPVLTVNYRTEAGLDSVGRPIEGVDIRIKDKNKDGVGEIQAKGANVMAGYYNNQAATEEVFDGGWFRTGDLGYIDGNNCLYIKGRDKNVIVSSAGKNIYPEEVEELVAESAYVLEIMVYGSRISRENPGQKVAALIYPDYDMVDLYFSKHGIKENRENIEGLIKKEVEKHTRHLPAYKKIKNIKIQPEEFQKTSTRKIKRYLYTENK